MKNILTALILMLFVGGCLKPFETKEQAKNEVNKKGYRVDRWVDYLDSMGVKTKDEINYKSYILSEYKDGQPLGNYREFNRNNTVISNGTFKSDGILCDMSTMPQLYVGCRELYDGNLNEVNLVGKQFYNADSELEKEIIYDIQDDKKDSLTIKLQYFDNNPDTNNSITNRELKEVQFYKNDTLKYKLKFDDTPWTKGLKKSEEFTKFVLSKLNPSEDTQKFNSELDREIYNRYSNLLFQPAHFSRLHFVYVKGDGNKKNEDIDIKTQLIEFHKAWLSTVDISSSSISACSYCGRNFNKQIGFVKGVQMTSVRRYSTVLFDLEVAKQMNPNIAKTLKWNYDNGTWYCSERCVSLSGNEILE